MWHRMISYLYPFWQHYRQTCGKQELQFLLITFDRSVAKLASLRNNTWLQKDGKSWSTGAESIVADQAWGAEV